MADPFTVLGATSSILTLVEFSWKLLSSAAAVYRTGESKDHAVLSTIAADIRQLAAPIVASPEYDQSLRDMIKESEAIAKALLDALEALKIQGKATVWKSFMVALKDVWKRKDIDAFSQRLVKLQSQVASHVQMVVMNRVSAMSRALADMERANKDLGVNMRTGFEGLRKDIIAAAEKAALNDSNDDAPALEVSENTDSLARGSAAGFSANLRDLSGTLTHLWNARRTTGENLTVLRSLYFNQIRTRYQKIPTAHAETFEWIFRPETSDDPRTRQIQFTRWLRDRDGVFWIQGKPGSGKSTLMKFISQHDETEHLLKIWAGDKELVLASYYFWYAGTPLQKSQVGLFRSILFDILRRFPTLIPRVIELRAGMKDDLNDDWSWTVDELLSICRTVLADASSAKFCIFLDGLDEYEEGRLAPEDLVESVQALTRIPNVKLCVSSRPWSVFADAFGSTDSSLKLEDLTRRDIYQYTSDKLNGNRQFAKMVKVAPACPDLVEEVTERARGVFLWVYLVVRNLLTGLTNGDSIHLLQSRLEMFPEDLDGFFRHMIATIPQMYRHHTLRLFEMVKSAPEPQYAMAFSFVDEVETDPELLLSLPIHKMLDSEIEWRLDQVRRRLDARGKGLLELIVDDKLGPYTGSKIDFLHRTVYEFLHRSDGLGVLFQDNQTSNSPSTPLVMCAALLATLKRDPDDRARQDMVPKMFEWARRVSNGNEAQTKLVNVLREGQAACDKMRLRFCSPAFHGLACVYGILPFVESELRTEACADRISKDSALNLVLSAVHTVPNLDVVKALLDAGANPNAKYGPLTAFGALVSNMGLFKANPAEWEDIKQILRMLLNHGADTDTTVTRGVSGRKAWQTIRESFPEEEDFMALSGSARLSSSVTSRAAEQSDISEAAEESDISEAAEQSDSPEATARSNRRKAAEQPDRPRATGKWSLSRAAAKWQWFQRRAKSLLSR
ncbi:hypothetical protein QBC47DRAFT_306088 [Echria macrotheca]|uniref:NACHT domain-containing protein n=1 Tax=Echria macrotheca TaxID=438768 RepID=A0AAJ0B6Z4_9PEZI|nr:hypothetical protein QBC47DRAFT_306088 [Echria macrotheca]